MERLNSFQSAILVKRMMQCYDSLSSRALEEKANDLGLYKTSANLSITWWHWLTCTSPNAIFLLERASRKRKRDESDNASRSIAWINPKLISHSESIPSNVDDKHREIKQAKAILLTSYYLGEVDVMSSFELNFNSGILTLVSNATNNDDTNDNLALSRKIVSKRTCMIHSAAQNYSTSSTTFAYCNLALFGHLSASIFSGVID